MTVIVGDITGVNRFLVHTGFTYVVDSLSYSHFGFQAYIFDRHNTAGTVFGVVKQFVDCTARFGVACRYYAFYNICGHFLDDINGVIKEHFVEDFVETHIGERTYQCFLRVTVHFDKGFRSRLFRKDAEGNGELFVIKFCKKCRYVLRVFVFEKLLKPLRIAFVKEPFKLISLLINELFFFVHFFFLSL